jgi:amino acid adenylation domain-containing protein
MEQVESGLRGWIDYNADLFDRATITRMIDHFHTLLEGIIANPENPIGSLALLSEAEKHRLLVEWSGTEKNYPRNKCVHQLFEEQVERTPDAMAVLFPSIASEPGADEQLTFRELNRRANRLARLLQTLGVGPDAPVGICMERSLEMVVGLLAILKAGGAYVPLDPGYPDERIAFMLEDSGVRVVLTQERLMPILPSRDARIVCVDAPDRRGELEALEAEANPADSATADNLAYVIYTSGSTGRPKGVLITHYNVTRLLAATDSWFHFDQNDVWTMFHSYAFDFSVWEMWGALLRGGRLVVVPFWASRSPELFYKLLSRERVTVLNQTPSAFAQLIQFEQSSAIAHDLALRLVILGGEALDFQSLKPWFERHGAQHPRLVNMYGITETTVHVTHRPVTAADLPARGSFVGLPIPDLGLYVLDQKQNPAPIGVPGELCVGGAGIARGYLNRPELTAEKFMPDPFSDEPGARLYRTGDLARYLPNRDIEYLGRIDAQVKIRGYRIELGEIEAVLSRHPSVREAVALAREDSPGEKRLAAYIVPGDGAVQAGELRDFLKRKLPEYMVPSAFVFLGSLPLTPNGKVDRKALPAPDQGRPELGEGYVVPRTPREELLAKTWAEVLQLEKVGVHDNFFDLGGHSLLATQVISRLRDAFHVDLPLRALFEHPTVAGLAERIETLPWAGEEFRTAGKITGEREEIKL